MIYSKNIYMGKIIQTATNEFKQTGVYHISLYYVEILKL